MRKLVILLLCGILLLSPCGVSSAEDPSEPLLQKNGALRLLLDLYAGQDTLAYSPLSLSVALSMAADGASGQTKEQLDGFIENGCPDWYVLEELSFSAVYMANAAFLRPGFTLLPEYEEALLNYNAEPTYLTGESAARKISDWVSGRTEGLIKDFLTQEPSEETQMLLVNALAMQARWVSPFNPANTNFPVFHAPSGDIEVSCMNQTAAFSYREVDGIQSVALPYKTDGHMFCADLEMIVLLPQSGDLLPLIEEIHTDPDAFLSKYRPEEAAMVQLSLPNVQIESAYELKPLLVPLGVTDAFDPAKADFSAMSDQADEFGLSIDSVYQQIALNVTEAGTEAAAATRVEMVATGAITEDIVCMNVDRPYMMLVYAPESGYVLFAACVNNPA